MALLSIIVVVSSVALASLINLLLRARNPRVKNGLRKLPGPQGLPFIGSIHELKFKNNWMKFHEWGEEYGPIYQVNLAGVNHVWITRDAVAHDLLTKRAAITSDRPHLAAVEEDNRTSGHYLPLMSKNEVWVRQRKFAKQFMDKSQRASFYDYPEHESIRMLMELLSDSSQYHHSMESFSARVTSRLAWGSPHASDELKQRARELLISVSPTGALSNNIPFLMFLPEKLFPPKAWERRRARTERRFFEIMQRKVEDTLSRSNQAALSSATQPKQTWMHTFLENKKFWGFASDMEGAYAVGMNGIAGALTIAAPMQSFCLALCHYPQFQPMLHEEIDRVVGDRLPRLSDMPEMPVLRAFIRETMRWRPSGPYGIPHELTEDVVYGDYHIPAGSPIHPLEWSIGRDPEEFPDPDAWNPSRWIDPKFPTYREPLTKYPTITAYSQFGYGHRICSGQPLVEADLFVGCGSIAWLFSIQAINKDGEEDNAEKPFFTPPPEEEVHGKLQKPTKEAPKDGVLLLSDSEHGLADSRPSEHSDMPLPIDFAERSISSRKSSPTGEPSSTTAWYESDPTMDFSTLLIAKPMPFKFRMKPRSQARAEKVAQLWIERKMEGEFDDATVFWEDDRGRASHEGNGRFGWGKIYA